MNNKRLPKIAILLATYNGEKFIEKQLSSIISQQRVHVDIFISDDTSNDQTLNICQSFSKNFSNIKILNKSNTRFNSAAKNFFRMITDINFDLYDFVGFCDQDDIWKPFKLYKGINKIKEGYSAYSSNVKPFKERKILKTVDKSWKQVSYDYLFEGGGAGSTYIVKKDIMISFQYLLKKNKWISDKINHHDWLLYAFTRYNYKNWFIDSFESVYYRQHSNNELGSSDSINALYKRVKFVLNGYALNQSKYIAKAINLERHIYNKIYLNRLFGLFLIMNFYKLRRSPKGKLIILTIGIISIFYPLKNDSK